MGVNLKIALAASALLLFAAAISSGARGQRAFCANSSHGVAGWDGTCRTTGREATEDAKQHKKDNPSHKDDVTTMACDLP